ncbi:hypothetical protein [Embleya sp. NPDC001921]
MLRSIACSIQGSTRDRRPTRRPLGALAGPEVTGRFEGMGHPAATQPAGTLDTLADGFGPA